MADRSSVDDGLARQRLGADITARQCPATPPRDTPEETRICPLVKSAVRRRMPVIAGGAIPPALAAEAIPLWRMGGDGGVSPLPV